MRHLSTALRTDAEAGRVPASPVDAMVALLRARIPASDAEALKLLRQAFPGAELAQRVAAFGRYRT